MHRGIYSRAVAKGNLAWVIKKINNCLRAKPITQNPNIHFVKTENNFPAASANLQTKTFTKMVLFKLLEDTASHIGFS